MKRNVHWDEEEESFYEDTNASENEESDNEEPRIKDVLENLSKTVSRERAAEWIYYTAWRLPKISCFGHLADSYSETSE